VADTIPTPPPTSFRALQGFYVVIDFHFEQSGLQNNPTLFASEWSRLWTDLVSLPTYGSTLSGRVFPELANEWDKFGCKWDTAGGHSEYSLALFRLFDK
jgi:hypothetical protein